MARAPTLFLGVKRRGIRGVEMGMAGCDVALAWIVLAASWDMHSGKDFKQGDYEEAVGIRCGRDGGSGRCGPGLDARSGQITGTF